MKNKDYTELMVAHSVVDGKSRRITRLTGDPGIEIFHECDRVTPWQGADTLLDGHVLAVLLYAMSRGKPLAVRGALSRGMLRNIEELQLIWSRWKPEVYSKIDIIPDKAVDARRRVENEKAISAFSGGADATFTALRHAKLLDENVRYPLTDVLMVHGFDVELKNPHYFETLKKRVRPLLDELGLNLREIRTDSKDWKRQHWNDSFAFELAACLHMFSDEFQYGLIGSSSPYESLLLPWGSSPLADHLMSGDAFAIVHDGAGFSRTNKMAEIARHPVACRTLKVCWAGENQSENCGHCEKCVRTMLNFLASGNPVPPCFPQGLDLRDIPKMKIYDHAQMLELADILADARKNNVDGPWIKAVKKRMRSRLTKYGPSLPRRIAGAALSAAGLKDAVKKLLKNCGIQL